MKKLAFIINVFVENDFHSGGERLFYELVKKAVNDGCIVDLYCTTYLGNDNILRPRLNKINFIGHPKDFKCPKKIEKFYDKVKKLIKDENYDRIISENISPPVDIGFLQGHSLVHYGNLSGNIFSRLFFNLKKAGHAKAQKKWLKHGYNKIIVPSNVLKEELKRNFDIPDEKITAVYPGTDKPEILSEDCRIPDEIFIFGLSAPSFGKKGGYVFMKALYLLKKKNYKFKARIICPKSAKNPALRFLPLIYGLKNYIEFLPYQKNMNEFYNSVDAIIMPSFIETFGLAATEAMIRGKPAVVSSFCGASEITDADFVFEMKTRPAENLADKLVFLLENKDKYCEFSKNAREIALNYNVKSFCNNFFEELRDKAPFCKSSK